MFSTSPHPRPGTSAKMAAGRKNMLATTWSNPIATKARIGKKIPRILPLRSLALMRQPDRQAHQPVAAHGAQEDLPGGLGIALELGYLVQLVEHQRPRSAGLTPIGPDHPGRHRQEVGHEQGADQVAHQHPGEVRGELPKSDALAHRRQRHQRHVAGEQVRARHDDEDQPDGEDRAGEQGGQRSPRLRVEARGDGYGDQPAEGDVRPGQEASHQRLVPADARLLDARLDCRLGDLLRSLDRRLATSPLRNGTLDWGSSTPAGVAVKRF